MRNAHSSTRSAFLWRSISARLLLIFVTVISIGLSSLSPSAAQSTVLNGESIRMLVVGDPFAVALQKSVDQLGQMAGGTITIEVVGYDDLYRQILLNARDLESSYDIISFDAVWVGEFGKSAILLPLNDLVSASGVVEPTDFLELAYASAQFENTQLGLPIQPHPELMWYRTDIFEAAGLKPPVTTDDVLAAAKLLTKPEQKQYGICWNGQRGQALGQQMAHFYAAFGQPLLTDDGQPALNTPKGIAAAKYALALLPYSPPDVLNMAWDQRPQRFGSAGCAMTYEWAARTYLVEDTTISEIAGKVGYIGAPHAPGEQGVTAMGAWHLGIPANIAARGDIAWKFLEWLTSSETQKFLATQGNGGMPRYSIMRDAELAKTYPAFAVVDELGSTGQLADWMRPAVPQWPGLADTLGGVYHDMLEGKMTPEQAAAEVQKRAETLFE